MNHPPATVSTPALWGNCKRHRTLACEVWRLSAEIPEANCRTSGATGQVPGEEEGSLTSALGQGVGLGPTQNTAHVHSSSLFNCLLGTESGSGNFSSEKENYNT